MGKSKGNNRTRPKKSRSRRSIGQKRRRLREKEAYLKNSRDSIPANCLIFQEDYEQNLQLINDEQRKKQMSSKNIEHFTKETVDSTSLSNVRENSQSTTYEDILSNFTHRKAKDDEQQKDNSCISSEYCQVKMEFEEELEDTNNYGLNNTPSVFQVEVMDGRSVVNNENKEKFPTESVPSGTMNEKVQKHFPQDAIIYGKKNVKKNVKKNIKGHIPPKVGKKRGKSPRSNRNISNCFCQKKSTTKKGKTRMLFSAELRNLLDSNKREELFGYFVASEVNALKTNSELYFRTKKAIIDLLLEFRLKQLKPPPITL